MSPHRYTVSGCADPAGTLLDCHECPPQELLPIVAYKAAVTAGDGSRQQDAGEQLDAGTEAGSGGAGAAAVSD